LTTFTTATIATTRTRTDYAGNVMIDVWAKHPKTGRLYNVHAYPVRGGEILAAGSFYSSSHDEWDCEPRWGATDNGSGLTPEQVEQVEAAIDRKACGRLNLRLV
jgi:hypothetical protein